MDIAETILSLMPTISVLVLITSLAIFAFLFMDMILFLRGNNKSKRSKGKKLVAIKHPVSATSPPETQPVLEKDASVASETVNERKAAKQPKAPSKWYSAIAPKFRGVRAEAESPSAQEIPVALSICADPADKAKEEPQPIPTTQKEEPQPIPTTQKEEPQPIPTTQKEETSHRPAEEKPKSTEGEGEGKIKVKLLGSLAEAQQIIAFKVGKAEKEQDIHVEGNYAPMPHESAQPSQPIIEKANLPKPVAQELSPHETSPVAMKPDAQSDLVLPVPASETGSAELPMAEQSAPQQALPIMEGEAQIGEPMPTGSETSASPHLAQNAEPDKIAEFSKELQELKETLVMLNTTLKRIGNRLDQKDEASPSQGI